MGKLIGPVISRYLWKLRGGRNVWDSLSYWFPLVQVLEQVKCRLLCDEEGTHL